MHCFYATQEISLLLSLAGAHIVRILDKQKLF